MSEQQFEAAMEMERAVRHFRHTVGGNPLDAEARRLAADAANDLLRFLLATRKDAA